MSSERRDAGVTATQRTMATWRRTWRETAPILTASAAALIAIWLIVGIASHAARDAAIRHATSEANNLSAAFGAEISSKLTAIGHGLDVLAAAVQKDPHLDLYAWAQQRLLLTTIPIIEAAVLAPDGTLFSSTLAPHPAPEDQSNHPDYRVQREAHGPHTFVGQLASEQVSGRRSIRISRRVEDKDGNLLGVVVFKVAPSQLTDLPKSVNLGPRGMLSLVGSDNVIRARFSADSPDGTRGAGIRVAPFPAVTGAPVQWFIRPATSDHVTRLFSIRPIAGYPLFAAVGFDLAEVLEPADVDARRLRAIGALATIVLAALMFLLVIEVRRRSDREAKLANEQARLATEVRLGQETQGRLQFSEARLRDFAVMASDWFWEQDAELHFTDIGIDAPYPGADGTSRVGRCRWDICVPSESQDFWQAHKQDLLARKPIRDFRYSLISRDGKLHHVSINGVPVHDSGGTFVGYRGTGRDITAEVEAAAELRVAKERAEQAEALLRDAVDSMSEGFVIFDHDDRFVMCNEPYRQLYPAAEDCLHPGVTFEAMLRSILAAGGFPDALGREAEWLAERLRQHHEASGSREQRSSSNRWILLTDRRMANGGTAGLRIDITRLKQAEAALRESAERLDRAQEMAGIGSWELDVATKRFVWSRHMYRMRGVTPAEFEPTLDNVASNVHPDDYALVLRWYEELMAGQERPPRETRTVRPNGEIRVVQVEGRPVVDDHGAVCRVAGTLQDVTERRSIERQLAQAVKMEAIGNLTGGMAHDFNNGLGVIVGNLDLLARLVRADATAAELCQEARDGATRCADLIRRLLAFARRQPLHPQWIDVNALIDDTARLLGRTLGEDIALTLNLETALPAALADAAQLEAAIVNLATNARDAMPTGGRIVIATRNVALDAEYVALHPEAMPGPYVAIEISDTGIGIPPEIINRIFEPFFTTKEPGAGSGLGLSMVFGFVKQSGGHLTVYSEPGMGTTFRIYLPQAHAGDPRAHRPTDECPVEGGHETVLVVEDNAQLRRATTKQLIELGYRVFDAEDASAGLRKLADGPAIDLLLTDVVMPGAMDGIDLACLATQRWPKMAILVTSGFATRRASDRRLAQHGFSLLAKPYRRDELARALRVALDGQRAATTGCAGSSGRIESATRL